MQPLSYALKTWKDKKEQFTTRNKMFTDTGHAEGRGGARSPLLFPLSQDVYWVLLLSGPSQPTTCLNGLLHICPPFPQTHAPSSSSFSVVSISFSLEGAVEFRVFQILLDKEKLSLPDQPQSETWTGQISLLLWNTDHFEEPNSKCLSISPKAVCYPSL